MEMLPLILLILVYATISGTPHPVPDHLIVAAVGTGVVMLVVILGVMFGRMRFGHAMLTSLALTAVWSVLLAISLI